MINACKKCRREGEKLVLKGERCVSPKCAMVKRPYAPGQHGQSFHGKQSEYGKQLREKQKARRIYGINEGQFVIYTEIADKMLGNKSDNLLKIIETRADNIVYRMGFATSRSHARQMVSHGTFDINGKRITIPSYRLTEGDLLTFHRKDVASKASVSASYPTWLEFDKKATSVKINHMPAREEIEVPFNESLIIEFYSR